MKKLLPFNFILGVILLVCLSTAGNAQVVISQIYGGGGQAGSTYKNDFIELFNNGKTPVSLNGWAIQYGSSQGTSWGSSNKRDLPNQTLAPGQYFLIQGAQGTSTTGGTTPLPTPDFITTLDLSGTNGKVTLVNTTAGFSTLCPTDDIRVDLVGYGAANCYEGAGAAPVASNTTSVIRASGGCKDSNTNSADFTTSFPTPRNLASPLNLCFAPPDIKITEIMYNSPDAGNDSIEFIELYNNGRTAANIKDWYFASGGITYKFPSYTMLPGTYYVVAREAASMKVTFGINNCPQWSFGHLSDLGAPIVIKDADGQVVDSVFYKPTAPWPLLANNLGASLTLCDLSLDNALGENWLASANQTAVNKNGQPVFASPGAPCSSGARIVITEIMYNPPESDPDSLEFIELYNNGYPVNLKDFYFSSGPAFTFPSVTLANGQYLLVAVKSSAIQNTFGKASLQWTSGTLSNTSAKITLKDNYGFIIDDVTYFDSAPWDTLADSDGPSLTLCDPNYDNAYAFSWKASTEYAATNSAGKYIYATPLGGCMYYPAPIANFNGLPTFVIEGGSIQFEDLSLNSPNSWSWSFPGGTPSTSTLKNPLVQYTATGLYPVTLTVKGPQGTNTMIKRDYINVGGVGVNYLSSNVALFPNPTNGKVSVTNPNRANQQIVVYSAIGKPVAFKNSDQEIISLDLTGQSKGVYLVKITNKATQTSQMSRIVLK